MSSPPAVSLAESAEGAMATLRRGAREVPAFRRALPMIAVLGLVATAGRLVVPLAIQQTLDRGLHAGSRGAEPVDTTLIRLMVLACAIAVVITATSAYVLNRRLFTATETALHEMRVRTFARLHALSMLHQQAQRRGSMVSRVTSDVDQLSIFMQWAGSLLLVSSAQMVVATALMLVFSWQLTLVVYVCFVPLVLIARRLQRRLAPAYAAVRARVGELLAAIAETVVGASTVRSYGAGRRSRRRIDAAVENQYRAQLHAQKLTVLVFTSGELAAALANASVVTVGVMLGVGGHLSSGELVAFLFLVTLFVQPVQVATEGLTEAQNALASFRRVLEVLDQPIDLPAPQESVRPLPAGALSVAARGLGFAYPGAAGAALAGVDVLIPAGAQVAIVGETGSGKTTFAKLVTRLMDPTHGRIELDGVALTDLSAGDLRARIGMVPQDGFLFEGTVADNIRFADPALRDDEVVAAFVDLGLGDWIGGLPDGIDTPVGQRGESLSVGERQLISLVRVSVGGPDVLVLDEATSAVDPATEQRLHRALDRITAGRTTITIAHRLTSAQAADLVLVFDAGRLAQVGTHHELARAEGPYARLFASWMAQNARTEASHAAKLG
jgi:ATP-binding cassette subfamily B protein